MELKYRVDVALNQLLFPTPLSQYQHMCPSYTLELPGEEEMNFRMLITMDGNESLKRNQIQRKVLDGTGRQIGVINVEQSDSRTRHSLIFVESESVDEFKDEIKKRKVQVI